MKLLEALVLARTPAPPDADRFRVELLCGFEPLHFATLLKAHLRQLLPGHFLDVSTGLFGDLIGNVERINPVNCDAVLLVVEWADLDMALGVRQLGIWNTATEEEIVGRVESMLLRLEKALEEVAATQLRVVCSMPTLPLPPFAHTPVFETSRAELRLRQKIAAFALAISEEGKVHILNAAELDRRSAHNSRRDIKSEILSGFPYQIPHADALAEIAACELTPPVPKKGLITDLDGTLWSGILGEVGVSRVHWDLDHKSQIHALYQQLLRSLAESGVLIGAASKNDPVLVHAALSRSDLLLGAHLFPVEASWGPKSESVRRILKTWNLDASAAVFADDSLMELAEVKAAFPQIECVHFTPSDPARAHFVLYQLRNLFGKSRISDEDSIRAQSLRRNHERAGEGDNVRSPTTDEFLQTAEATLTIIPTKQPLDSRALELVNKTNQFNLNGHLFQETEWNRYVAKPERFYMLISYSDKFGPLGKIAVVCGRKHNGRFTVDTWVMSCRAFSRRIEHACLKYVFDRLDVEEIHFEFRPTERNGPLQDFLKHYFNTLDNAPLVLLRETFTQKVPRIFANIEEVNHG